MAESLGQAVLEVGVDDSRLRAGLKGVEQQAAAAGQAVAKRFTASGKEILTANNGLEYFIDASGRARRENGRFVTATERAAAGIGATGESARGAGDKLGSLGGAVRAVSGAFATFGAVAIFQDLIKSATELENITRKLTNTLGDQGAQQALGFLRGLSDSLGLSFNVLADSFGSFTAAASAANIPLSEQKDLFAAVSTSAQRLGLSNDAINGSLLALQQVAAKGTVQMEELRGQLGERLPTAFAATAQGLGITNAELIKLVESGKLTAEQFFPALTKGLNELNGSGGGALPTATQNFASLGNELEKFKAAIGQDLLPAVLAFTQALSSGLAGPVKSELVSTNNAISFLKDTIADQTEFGVDTTEAERKLAQLQIKAEELQAKLGGLNREDEIKTEVLGLERQRRELERQGIAADAITEKTKLLSQELFLLTGSADKVRVGRIFNGLAQDEVTLTPALTPQLKEARAEQEKINGQLETQRAARERLVAFGKSTEQVDARILSLQERSQGLLAGIGAAALDRIQKQKDAKIQGDREEAARDAKRFDTEGKREERLKVLRKENKGLADGSSKLAENEREIASLEAQTDKGAKKLADAGIKIGEEIAKGAKKLEDAVVGLQKAREAEANAINASQDIASAKALNNARNTFLQDIEANLTSGNIDKNKVANKFGVPSRLSEGSQFDLNNAIKNGGTFAGGTSVLDLSSLSLEKLAQLSQETSSLADAQASVTDAQKANTEATNENNRLLALANGRQSNLAITVPVGATKSVYLP